MGIPLIFREEGRLLAIVAMLLGINWLPLAFIAIAAFLSEGFTSAQGAVYVATTMSTGFFSLFRDTFGYVIVPLITAYAIVPPKDSKVIVPGITFFLFILLAITFAVISSLYALIVFHDSDLSLFNISEGEKLVLDVANVYKTVLTNYAKETLGYIALLLGISLKKSS